MLPCSKYISNHTAQGSRYHVNTVIYVALWCCSIDAPSYERICKVTQFTDRPLADYFAGGGHAT